MKPCLLYLTCANKKEANLISQSLLEKRLVVCVKKCSVSSSYLWKGKIESSEEVMLIMDSVEENFEKVNADVTRLHSYESFVLVATPVTQTTEKVKKWMKTEIEN